MFFFFLKSFYSITACLYCFLFAWKSPIENGSDKHIYIYIICVYISYIYIDILYTEQTFLDIWVGGEKWVPLKALCII